MAHSLIPEGTFLSLHFEFRHSQGYVERPWLKKSRERKKEELMRLLMMEMAARHGSLHTPAWEPEFTQRIQSQTLPQKLGREKESQF